MPSPGQVPHHGRVPLLKGPCQTDKGGSNSSTWFLLYLPGDGTWPCPPLAPPECTLLCIYLGPLSLVPSRPYLPWLFLVCFFQASSPPCFIVTVPSLASAVFSSPQHLQGSLCSEAKSFLCSSAFLLVVSYLLKEEKTETWPFLSLLSPTSGPPPCVLSGS